MATTLFDLPNPELIEDQSAHLGFYTLLASCKELMVETDRILRIKRIQVVEKLHSHVDVKQFEGKQLSELLPQITIQQPFTTSASYSNRQDFTFDSGGEEFTYRAFSLGVGGLGHNIVLQNRTRYQELKDEADRREQYRHTHQKLTKAIMSKNDVEELLWAITERCVSLLKFEDCVIYLYDKETKQLTQRASFGNKRLPGQKVLNPISLALGEGIVGSVAKTGKSEIVNDVSMDDRYVLDDMARASEMAVPMKYEGEVIGVIDSENSQKGFYNPELLEMVEGIATIAAIKITAARARKKIAESEQKFRSIIENTTDMIMIMEPDGRIEYTNPSVERVLGYDNDELVQANFFDFLPESFHKDCMEDLSDLLTGKQQVVYKEHPLVHENGGWIYVEVAARVMMEGAEVKILCNSRDVTVRKQTDAELRMARRALESTSDPITITDVRDPQRPVVYANPAFCELVGAKAEEVIGFPSQLQGKKTDKKVVRDIYKAQRLNQPFSGELIAYRRDKSHFWTHLTMNPVFDERTGDVTHTVDVHKDISSKKEDQKKLMETILDTQENERKRIAHDLHDGLGQTLSAANMFITAIGQEVDERFSSDYREFYGSASKLMKTAVEEARGISHNLMPNSLKQFGLHQSIEELVEYNNAVHPRLKMDFKSNIKGIRFESNREIMLYRIIQEIINNTVKHAKASNMFLAINLKNEDLSIYASDNGRGFDPERTKGKGLGLEGLRNRVKMLEGTMQIDASPGTGTTFSIAANVKPKAVKRELAVAV